MLLVCMQVAADELIFGPLHVLSFFAWMVKAEGGSWQVIMQPTFHALGLVMHAEPAQLLALDGEGRGRHLAGVTLEPAFSSNGSTCQYASSALCI